MIRVAHAITYGQTEERQYHGKWKEITKKEVVVVTGAGGALCSAFAAAMAKKGYQTALLDINLDAAEQVAQQIRENGGIAHAYRCDVLDRIPLQQSIAKFWMIWGHAPY